MAQFRVNDLVVVNVFDEDELTRVQFRGRILEVTGEDPDEYLFFSEESDELFIGNDDIVELISGPSADLITSQTVDTSTLLVEDRRRNSASIIDWETNLGRIENIWRESRPIFISSQAQTPPEPPQPADPFLEQHPAFVTATELTFQFDGRTISIPILDHNETRNAGVRIGTDDYNPHHTRRRLMRFRINDLIISPVWDEQVGIVFLDQIGRRWYNSVLYSSIKTRYTGLIDASSVHWMLRSEYNDRVRASTSSLPRIEIKPRKKLRHKYGKMPVVKTEDHYASKEYIA